jgi:hypothetical protein
MTTFAAPSRFPRASAVLAVGLACTALVLLALPRDIEHRVRTTRGGIQRLDADTLHDHGTEGHVAPVWVAGADQAPGLAADEPGDDHGRAAAPARAFRLGPPGRSASLRAPVPSPPTFDRPLAPSAGRAPPFS